MRDEPRQGETKASRKRCTVGVGFGNLARIVAERWKNIDEEYKEELQRQSKLDHIRQQALLEEWRAKKERTQKQAKQPSIGSGEEMQIVDGPQSSVENMLMERHQIRESRVTDTNAMDDGGAVDDKTMASNALFFFLDEVFRTPVSAEDEDFSNMDTSNPEDAPKRFAAFCKSRAGTSSFLTSLPSNRAGDIMAYPWCIQHNAKQRTCYPYDTLLAKYC